MSDLSGAAFIQQLQSGPQSGAGAVPGTAGNVSPYDAAAYGISSTYAAVPVKWQISPVAPVMGTGKTARPHEPDTVTSEVVTPGYDTKTLRVIDALDSLYTLSESDLAQLQKDLWQGGFYSPTYYGRSPRQPQYGVVQPDTIAAFKNALDYTVHTERTNPNTTVQQVINAAVRDRAKGGQGALAPLPSPHIDLANPDDLAMVFQQTAQKMIGQKLSDSQIQGMISAYQQLQSTAQTSVQQDAASGTGGTTVSAPPPDAYAAAQLNQNQGPQVGAHDIASQFSNFVSILKGGMT